MHSGVVGRERMGTAFPHKKLSGNGVPTREILRYLFIITIKLAIFTVTMLQSFHAPQTMSKEDIKICIYLHIKTKFQWYVLHVDGLYQKIHEFPLKLFLLTSGI